MRFQDISTKNQISFSQPSLKLSVIFAVFIYDLIEFREHFPICNPACQYHCYEGVAYTTGSAGDFFTEAFCE